MTERAHWKSKAGFILAAAGSAVGLGNIWRFPYETGENGGGVFVLVYVACVILIGLPVMVAEILLGRASQRSPVSAFKRLAGARSGWVSLGWLGVASAFCILSFYSVVAGWSMHYTWLSLTGQLREMGPEGAQQAFGQLFGSAWLNVSWHVVFMGLTVGVIMGGVGKGLERWARILMPALFAMLGILLIRSFTLPGFGPAMGFVFGFHAENFTAGGVLEALGQSFFSLSLGMGAMLTYGSYLHKDDDIMGASVSVCALDTGIALVAAMVLFPIIFTNNMEPAAGPGLVFLSIPVALSSMPGGGVLATIFFSLLVVAALTSSIAMLEVAASYLIDDRGWSRRRASLAAGAAIALTGIPAALSGATHTFGDGFASLTGMNWFDALAYLSNNWMLPLGGLGIAVYTGWRMDDAIRHDHFLSGSKLGVFYRGWLVLLKFLTPVAIAFVFVHAVGGV